MFDPSTQIAVPASVARLACVTVPVVDRVVVETPVAPVIAPDPEILMEGVEIKLSKPLPNDMALNVLSATAETFAKLMPVMVFKPVVAVPASVYVSPTTAIVPELAVFVIE